MDDDGVTAFERTVDVIRKSIDEKNSIEKRRKENQLTIYAYIGALTTR